MVQTSRLVKAAQYGQLDVVKLLHNGCSGYEIKVAAAEAASRDVVKVLKFLKPMYYELNFDLAVKKAAASGQSNAAYVFLDDDNYEYISGGSAFVVACEAAAENGHTDLLQFLGRDGDPDCYSFDPVGIWEGLDTEVD